MSCQQARQKCSSLGCHIATLRVKCARPHLHRCTGVQLQRLAARKCWQRLRYGRGQRWHACLRHLGRHAGCCRALTTYASGSRCSALHGCRKMPSGSIRHYCSEQRTWNVVQSINYAGSYIKRRVENKNGMPNWTGSSVLNHTMTADRSSQDA